MALAMSMPCSAASPSSTSAASLLSTPVGLNHGSIDFCRPNVCPSSLCRALPIHPPLSLPTRFCNEDTSRGDGEDLTTTSTASAAAVRILLSNSKRNCLSTRRLFAALCHIPFLALPEPLMVLPAHARDRRNKRDIPLDSYQTTSDGLKYYDFLEGKGAVAEKGQMVMVHFDCIFRGIDAVSSRESKLLGGNRIIAQPYELVVGSLPGKERKRDFVENANGLFSAQAAPKPPPALYTVTEGMRVGGKRTVIVPPELGYGSKGSNEIPPGATFQMDVELLEVKSGPSS